MSFFSFACIFLTAFRTYDGSAILPSCSQYISCFVFLERNVKSGYTIPTPFKYKGFSIDTVSHFYKSNLPEFFSDLDRTRSPFSVKIISAPSRNSFFLYSSPSQFSNCGSHVGSTGWISFFLSSCSFK